MKRITETLLQDIDFPISSCDYGKAMPLWDYIYHSHQLTLREWKVPFITALACLHQINSRGIILETFALKI